MYAADVAEPATKDKYAHVCCCAMLLPPQQQLLFHIISWFVIVVMFSIIFVFQSKFIAVFGIIIVACHRHQYVNCKENSELFHGIETEVLLVDFGAFLWTFRLFSLQLNCMCVYLFVFIFFSFLIIGWNACTEISIRSGCLYIGVCVFGFFFVW